MAPEINLSLDQSEGSLLSDDFLDTPDDLDINVDDIETPDETDSLEFLGNGNELEWEGEAEVAHGSHPEPPAPLARGRVGFSPGTWLSETGRVCLQPICPESAGRPLRVSTEGLGGLGGTGREETGPTAHVAQRRCWKPETRQGPSSCAWMLGAKGGGEGTGQGWGGHLLFPVWWETAGGPTGLGFPSSFPSVAWRKRVAVAGIGGRETPEEEAAVASGMEGTEREQKATGMPALGL